MAMAKCQVDRRCFCEAGAQSMSQTVKEKRIGNYSEGREGGDLEWKTKELGLS